MNMAPKPQNHNPTNLKNGPSRFLVSGYPNKSIILKYMINGLSKNGKDKLAFYSVSCVAV